MTFSRLSQSKPPPFTSFAVSCMFFSFPLLLLKAFYTVAPHSHDWPDHDALRILQQARVACSPESKLIIMDHLISFACKIPPDDASTSLINKAEVPKPLLENLGIEITYLLDLMMLSLVNGVERTIHQWQALVAQAGFRIDRYVFLISSGWIVMADNTATIRQHRG